MALFKIQVFWNVNPWQLVNSHRRYMKLAPNHRPPPPLNSGFLSDLACSRTRTRSHLFASILSNNNKV